MATIYVCLDCAGEDDEVQTKIIGSNELDNESPADFAVAMAGLEKAAMGFVTEGAIVVIDSEAAANEQLAYMIYRDRDRYIADLPAGRLYTTIQQG